VTWGNPHDLAALVVGAGPTAVGAGHPRSGAQAELAQPRAGRGSQVGGDPTARTLDNRWKV